MSTNCGIAGLNGMFYNPYMIDDYDMDYNSGYYPSLATGSIWGNGFTTPMMGYTGGTSMEDIRRNMREQQQFYTDYNIEQQQLNRNADARINAPMELIKSSASVLKDKIVSGEQDQVLEAYENYLNAVSTAYGGNIDAKAIKARANTLYAEMNGGKTVIQDLREYGHSSATQGFIQAITLGSYGRNSAEDNISAITGAPVGTGEKTSQNMGRLAGIATIGAVAAGIAKACKGSGRMTAIVGAAAAGVSALMTFITGKVTT